MSSANHNNNTRRSTRRTLTLAKSRASGEGYTREKHDTRFVITDNLHRIPRNTQQEILQILQGDDRKGNNVRNSIITKDATGITAAELITISQIIISSTKKGLVHKMTKKSNTNLSSANSNQISNVTSRELLKNITKLNISDSKLMMLLKHCVYFLQGILNERLNFESNKPINYKLRLTTSQQVSADDITEQLAGLGISESNS